MSLPDIAGLLGVLLILAAYAGAQLRRLDPLKAPALVMNLTGALLILVSLANDWNLSAAVMEAAWALVALYGLSRLIWKRSGRRAPERAAD